MVFHPVSVLHYICFPLQRIEAGKLVYINVSIKHIVTVKTMWTFKVLLITSIDHKERKKETYSTMSFFLKQIYYYGTNFMIWMKIIFLILKHHLSSGKGRMLRSFLWRSLLSNGIYPKWNFCLNIPVTTNLPLGNYKYCSCTQNIAFSKSLWEKIVYSRKHRFTSATPIVSHCDGVSSNNWYVFIRT